MRNKTIAVFSVGLILLAACGREFKSAMSEQDALENLTNVTELSGYSAWGKKKPSKPLPPPVSYVELQALLVKLVQEGKIQVPATPTRGAASSQDIINAINAINAIFAAIPQTNGQLSSFSLALSMIAVFAGNLQQGKMDLNTVLAILNQSLPYLAVAAPQFVPVVQALIVIIPIVVTIMNTMNPPTAMLHTLSYGHAA